MKKSSPNTLPKTSGRTKWLRPCRTRLTQALSARRTSSARSRRRTSAASTRPTVRMRILSRKRAMIFRKFTTRQWKKRPIPRNTASGCPASRCWLRAAWTLSTAQSGSRVCSLTVSSPAWARCSALCRRCSCCSSSSHSWNPAATCPVSRSCWTASSASSAFRANPSSRCSSAPAAAFRALWPRVPLKMNATAA